jgi:hypothetical protein
MFAANALGFRNFPLPMGWQRVSGQGHAGSVTVASWDRQYQGAGGVWGSGEFLDPRRVPEVLEAVYLLEKGLIGPSVDLDPDLAYEVVAHPTQPDEFAMKVTRANVHGVTLVMSPAFPQVHITVDDDAEMAVLASAGITCAMSTEFAVNSTAWRKFPLAPRETKFSFETAENNIAAWSGGDPAKYGSAFLWKDDKGNPLNRETYRLPIIDVIDGKAYLIPRAVFSAGVIMSGGHGGLYDTLDENQRIKVQQVLTDIYDMLRDEYADPRVVAPWQRGGRQGADSEVAPPSQAALADDAFQLIDDEEYAMTASGMVKPPDFMFANPALAGPTPLRVDKDGHVYGHLATWKQCHMGVGNRCVIAPHSKTNYGYFKQGSVLTKGGKLVRVGKITLGTGHADESFGVVPAVEHYDNTGSCVAVVNAGEDSFGVWVAGALVDSVTESSVAELRRSPLSGDWRRVQGNLELVAALAVNSPGFPVLHEDGDGAYSLTAAGMVVEQYAGVVEDVGVQAGTEAVPVGQSEAFVDVDAFLARVAGDSRAAGIAQAFHDLLPVESDCGCGQ